MISTVFRCFGFVLSQLLIAYWFCFAFVSYPWIVPADHSSEAVRIYRHASNGGLLMMVASTECMIFCLLSWVDSRKILAIPPLVLSISALAIFAVSIPMIFPSEQAYELGDHRFVGLIGNIAAIIFGALSYRKYQEPKIG